MSRDFETALAQFESTLDRKLARLSSSASGSKMLKLIDAADEFIKAALTTAGVVGGAGLVGFGLELAGVAHAGQAASVIGFVIGGTALCVHCAVDLFDGLTIIKNVTLKIPDGLAAHTLRYMAEQMDKADRVIIASGGGIPSQPDAKLADDLVKFLERGSEVGFSFRILHQQVLDNGTRITRDAWQELSDILTAANILIKDKGGTRLNIPLDTAVGLIRHPSL